MKNIALGTHFQGLNRQFSFKGLLDKFSGAAAGYSLRKLSKSATNAVRVRRSSDNTEQDIGFVGTELDTTTLLDFVNARDVAPADYGAGAAAAYSLRYVSDSYTGDVVRVRRSVDNAEADFNPTEITDGTLLSFVNGVNFLSYSEEFNEPYYAKTLGTITANQTIAPDGSLTADLFTKTSAVNTVSEIKRINPIYPSTGIYTYSIYVKQNVGDDVLLRLDAGGNTANASFKFSTKTISTSGANVINATATELSDGWFRLTLTGNVTSTNWVLSILTLFINPTNDSFFVWGAQLEKGSTATDYTETTDAPAGYGYVTTWYDQSGNSNDASQSTAASQPKIVDAGVLVEENGKPAVDFDGGDDYLLNTTFTIDTSSGFTLFFLEKENSLPPNNGTFNVGTVGTMGVYAFYNSGPTYTPITVGVRSNVNKYRPTGSIARDTNQKLLAFIFDGIDESLETSFDFSINNSLINAVDVAISIAAITSNEFRIGRAGGAFTGEYFIGKKQEFIIYPSDQSSNRGNIEANVNDYYSIYTSTNDGFVTTWYDQSGNGNDATQGSAASQPKIVDAGVLVTENGTPAIDFTGNKSVAETSVSLSQPFTYFGVHKYFNVGLNREVFVQQNVGDYGRLIDLGFTSNHANFGNYIQGDATTFNQNSRYILASGVSSQVQDNGKTLYTRDGGTNGLNGLRIGYSNFTPFFSSNVLGQEVIVYNSDQSTSRTGIEANINKGFNIYWDGTQKGLLDTYTGAEAAYSLRALNSAYTGAILRVRRDSDNAEQDIYAKWDGTLNVEALETFCAATDGYVVTWYDQSGNANNATQATAASQPQIVSSGSIITDSGYQVIQYDGSDDNLGTSFTATGTMLMGGADGGAFYEVAISGAYNLLADASATDHPLKESIRIIWGRTLSAGEQSAIESRVTYSDWDFSDVTSFFRYYFDRVEFTSFPIIDTSNAFILNNTFRSITNITSFPLIDTSNATDFTAAWRDCNSLLAFPSLNFNSGITFSNTWLNCTSLQDFPANMFDSCTATNFGSAFTNTNLTQTSIDNILVSIDTAGQSGGTFDQSGGSAPSAVGEAAIDNLRARGWTVTVTGGY